VIPWRLNFFVEFRCRGFTQKKEYDIQNTARVCIILLLKLLNVNPELRGGGIINAYRISVMEESGEWSLGRPRERDNILTMRWIQENYIERVGGSGVGRFFWGAPGRVITMAISDRYHELFDLAPRGDRNIRPSVATQLLCRKREVRSAISKVCSTDPKGSVDQLPRIHFSDGYFDVYSFFIEAVMFFKLQGESLARGPKLLSIKNYVIEIMT